MSFKTRADELSGPDGRRPLEIDWPILPGAAAARPGGMGL